MCWYIIDLELAHDKKITNYGNGCTRNKCSHRKDDGREITSHFLVSHHLCVAWWSETDLVMQIAHITRMYPENKFVCALSAQKLHEKLLISVLPPLNDVQMGIFVLWTSNIFRAVFNMQYGFELLRDSKRTTFFRYFFKRTFPPDRYLSQTVLDKIHTESDQSKQRRWKQWAYRTQTLYQQFHLIANIILIENEHSPGFYSQLIDCFGVSSIKIVSIKKYDFEYCRTRTLIIALNAESEEDL